MLLKDAPADVVSAVVASMADRCDVDERYLRDELGGSEVRPVYVDGSCVGGVLMIGPHVHACVSGGFGRWLSRRVLRETIGRVCGFYGKAITSVADGNDAGLAFVSRLGFREFLRRDGVVWFEVEKWDLKRFSV